MFESFILGAVQGVAEWLPISSEAMVVLVKNNFFSDGMSFLEMIHFAIFLHVGTLLAVCVYYRKKIYSLIVQLLNYKKLEENKKKYLNFIIIATLVSGMLGIGLITLVEKYESFFNNEIIINIAVALFLSVTAILLYISEQKNTATSAILTGKRAIVTGLFQGLAAIPGISRSGSTVAGMGLLGINKKQALELSFILSIPLVFLANIILNFHKFLNFDGQHLVAITSSFIFGLITIDLLLRIVDRMRFSYFVGMFAILLIIVTTMLS